MAEPVRVTIDVTVARDFLDPRRERHADALALFDLARAGLVEIAAAASGFIYDADGDLGAQLRRTLDDEAVDVIPQLPYPGERLYPGPTLFPGTGVEGFHDAWTAVLADWRGGQPPGSTDALHVESHVKAARDVFITDDQALVAMCRRLRDEHGFRIEAMTLADYLGRHRTA